jgi:hypothetical protein
MILLPDDSETFASRLAAGLPALSFDGEREQARG